MSIPTVVSQKVITFRIVIPGKLAIASATGIQKIKKFLDSRLRGYDGTALAEFLRALLLQDIATAHCFAIPSIVSHCSSLTFMIERRDRPDQIKIG